MERFWRWLGMGLFGAIGLTLAAGVIVLVYRNFDYNTLLTIAVICTVAQFLAWPLAWRMAAGMTERIFRTWYERQLFDRPTAPMPGAINETPSPANPRAMIPLDVTESEAKEFLASLGA
jgi:hypothetical protein